MTAAVQAHDATSASAVGGDPTPALIVLGRDDTGKPHASWFDASEAKLAYQAAGLMGMRALTVATDELRAVAAQLAHGRVFSSGRAFVPFVKGTVYDALVQHLPPGSDDTVRPVGGEPGSGRDSNDEGDGRSDSDADDATSTWTNVPGEWATIGVGNLVLAPEANEGDGWFEAIVTEVREGDLFLVTWRDWPSEPGVLRHRWHLALLHPEHDQHGGWWGQA